jgi:hypothetical protein
LKGLILLAVQAEVRVRKVKQVFNYIKVLNELRNPVVTNINEQLWSLWLNDLPNHEAIKLYEE